MSPDLFVRQYTKSVAAQADHYVDVFVRENVVRVMTLWRRYDVRLLMLTPFCLEKTSVRKMKFKVLAMLPVGVLLESGTICKNKDHTCLFHFINTCRSHQKMFEHSA